MQVEIHGVVHAVLPPVQVTEKMRKSLMVVQTDSRYDNLIPVEFVNAKADEPSLFKVGELVVVHAYIGGREWTDKSGVTKYFPSITGDRIDVSGQRPSAPQGQTVADLVKNPEGDGLPF